MSTVYAVGSAVVVQLEELAKHFSRPAEQEDPLQRTRILLATISASELRCTTTVINRRILHFPQPIGQSLMVCVVIVRIKCNIAACNTHACAEKSLRWVIFAADSHVRKGSGSAKDDAIQAIPVEDCPSPDLSMPSSSDTDSAAMSITNIRDQVRGLPQPNRDSNC